MRQVARHAVPGRAAGRRDRLSRTQLAPRTATPSSARDAGSGTRASAGVSTKLSMLSLKSEPDIAVFAFKVISSSDKFLPANTDAASVVQLSYFGLKTLVLNSVYCSTPADDPLRNPST